MIPECTAQERVILSPQAKNLGALEPPGMHASFLSMTPSSCRDIEPAFAGTRHPIANIEALRDSY